MTPTNNHTSAKVILIQPTFSEHIYALDELTPPMALLQLAAAIIPHGFEPIIINQQTDTNWKETLLNELKNNPVCVGITALTGLQIYFAVQAAKLVKEHSTVPVVWGGIHATMVPEHTIQNKYVDYVLTDEAEESFPAFVKALANQEPLQGIPGLVTMDDTGAVVVVPQNTPPDLEKIPSTPFELDALFNRTKNPRLTIITSRGCPHRCAFCFNNFYYKRRWRAMSADHVLHLIDHYLETYGPESRYAKKPTISFGTESNFFVSAKRVDQICQGLLDRKIKVTWEGVSCRVDYHKQIKESTLKKLKALGCDRLLTGVEGGNQQMLDRIKKDIKIKDVFLMGEKLVACGIKFHTSFIMGLPGETEQDRMAIVDLISSLRSRFGSMHTYSIFSYAPFPGTDLWEEGLKLGYKPPAKLTDWVKAEARFPQQVPWLNDTERVHIQRLRELALIGGVYCDNSLAGKIYGAFGKWGTYRLQKHFFGPVPEVRLQTFLNDIYNLIIRGKRRKYQTFHHDPMHDKIDQLLSELE
ncbi:MAG TPA: hypothetical protein DEQ20_10605 [Desulfobulbaceae bacterium]|nr:MAG: hypothetical protein A2520_06480 [Deltaproteobacteria bacterium RIFOXYD12_FULL_53_23]HCC55352.1 hypothetical protein [Desulfobulbaceae bacterium]